MSRSNRILPILAKESIQLNFSGLSTGMQMKNGHLNEVAAVLSGIVAG
jgi:hypothetical protein